ncbi:hemagglutinin repeat-containing protein [Collimonas sp. OK412]|jgi:filamentous hemagglutinin|uniref:hemagglutinin repeat-containing protein n=1 Tax=Collimonas sp. (strain OK412) TaxID=1801619 RepID=UPI0008EEDCC0|nr:hemagglutinin repeat-containing protein [Collimonas sp. OK412]SFB69505.1 filamentous hemagglutinin [Collimonas sp. OK412]
MNKQNFRVIFNKNRGMLMAVAENVTSQGKGSEAGSTSSATGAPLMRFAQLTVAVAALFGGVTLVSAQIVADPNAGNRRPTVTQTANGIPLVNIVAPNGAGVSQNQYTQFSAGNAVLNNSATSVQTQQAGWVAGNGNLTPGNSARIILNEVTGTSRSQLNGYIEVAGQKAQVVIANVNGISCSGCGFINTSRGVLTTGTPVFGGDGSLQAFRVTRGDIQIGANGLNGNNLDQLDLIARSVSVNGQLWANNLNVVAGANTVNYADLGVQVIQGDDGKPTVGIDVASIGGMYANKIKLVGTEAGVGVVSLGNIAAQAGDLNIDNQGMITLNGKTTASGQVRIVGNDGITNSGTLYGQQAVQLYSAGQIANSGTVAAQSDLGLFSGSINSTGALGAGVDANGHATQAGSISLTAAGNIAVTGQNTASTDIQIGGAVLNLAHAQLNAGRNVGLAARAGGIDQTGASLQAAGTATINATGLVVNDQGSVNAAQIGINAGSLSNTGGSISQSGTGDTSIVTSGALNNAGTIATNANNLSIQSGSLSNNGGQINHAGSGTTTIQTGTFSNVQGAIATNGAARITAGAATNNGTMTAQQTLDLTATSLNNNGGTLASNAAMSVNAGTQLTNSAGTIQAGTTASPSSVKVTAANLDNSSGALGAGTIDLEATNLVNAAGKIIQNNTNGTATINVSQLLNNSKGIIGVVANNVTVAAGTINNDSGSLAHTGAGALTVNTGALSNNGGVLGTNGAATITASSIVNQGGKLTAVGNESVTSTGNVDNSQGGYIGGAAVTVNATGGQINNQAGVIEGATAGATVNTQALNNAAGKIQNLGTGAVAVTVAQALNNATGSISGKGAVTANAGSINNAAGAIGALGDLSVSSSSTLDNTNGSIEAMGNVAATAQGALTNVGGKIEALGSTGQLQVAGTTIDNTNGKIINIGSGQTTVAATTSLTNANPSAVSGAGLIGGAGDVTIATPILSNTQGGQVIAGGALNLNTPNSVNNTGGQLIATNTLTLNQSGTTLTNVGGAISGGNVALTTASIDNSNGSIANPAGSGNIAINTATLTNTNGAIGSGQDLQLAANTLTGDGKIVAGRDGNVGLQGDYTYDAGNQITANRNLTLSTTGNLVNTGTLAAAGNISLNAANVWNAAGADIASGNPGDTTTGTTTINAGAGGIANAGRIEGNNVNTTSNQLGNTGTLIGNKVTVNANTVTNDGAAAIIAGVNQVNLWVANTLTNQNGATLYSLGDLNIAANGAKDANGYLFNQTGTINNLSSMIEADGTLNIAANQINNVRQNVQTNTVTVSDTTSTMTQSPWWTSLAPGSTPTRNSNTQMHNDYYLNPSSIVSVTPIVTPDGYLIYKAVVNLSANDSAFQIMTGGLVYPLPNGAGDIQYMSQSRVAATAGQQVIYFTARTDNQVNPDQIAGNSAWADYNANTFRNVLGTITYSNQYGNCTTNCVRLITIPDYTDPTATFQNDTQLRHAYFPGSYPVEVERIAHQVVTETQLATTTGAPAKITSGGDMHMAIGTQLNNNNGQIAAGGNLTIDGVASADGSNNTKIVNTSTQLTRTYSSTNQSGFGTSDSLPAPAVEWTTWSNTPITLNIGVAGGTITSNQAVSISGGQVSNNSVGASTRPVGTSAGSLGLGDGIVPLSLVGGGNVGSIPVVVPGAARVVDGARAGAVNTVLPTNGLYSVRPQPNQQYLIATDPRFTQYGNFISSDYMLGLLGINPAATQKRLGDGFYEEKLVTDQVTNLTGKRYLNGYASAEDEYKSLMTNGAQYAKQFNMVPGLALSDAQMAALTTDIVWLVSQTVTLPDGSQQTVLVPQVYLAKNMDLTPTGALIAGDAVSIQGKDIINTGGTISGKQQLLLAADHDISNIGGTLSGGNIGLFAGNNILDQSVTNTAISNFGNNSSTVTAVGAVGKIAATNNLVMSAGQNLTLHGAQVGAGGNAMLTAGNAINVETVATGTHYVSQAGSTTTDQQVTHSVGSTVAAGGNLGLVSKGDLTVTAGNLSAGKDMLVAAGGNVTIQNATDNNSFHSEGQGKAGHTEGSQVLDEHMQNAVGSSLTAGGNATVLAGAQQDAFGNVVLVKGAPAKDLTLTASTITAGTNADGLGNATLGATGNVTLGEAISHADFSQEDRSHSHGLLSSSSSHDVITKTENTALGSTVSGNQVNVTAGNDVTVRGSGIAATSDLNISAGNNVNIVTSQSNQTETGLHEKSKSGLMGSGGIGFTVGNRSQNGTETATSTTNNSSTVGSIDGNVNINAGNTYNQSGSNVIAMKGDIGIAAQKVNIVAVKDTSSDTQTSAYNQSGLTLAVSAPVITAIQGIQQMGNAASKTDDTRMKVLAGAAAGSMAYNAYDGVAQNAAAGKSQATGFTVSLTVGSSSSNSQSTQSSSTVVGSNVKAGGNVSIKATGAGKDSDINVIGSNVNAGQDALLKADGDINLKAAQSTTTQQSTSSSNSGAVGIAATYGKDGFAFGITASASGSRGNGNGADVTNVNSNVGAGNTLVLSSGHDTNIQGAVAGGNQVFANVGTSGQGNLNIQSLQDTSTYKSKDQAIGGTVTIGYGASGSINASQSKVDGDYASVTQQSGIKAGDGGFVVNVNGNTDLKGGVIASTATPDKNLLVTQTLTQSNIENTSHYSASAASVGGGYGISGSSGGGGTAQGANLLTVQQGGQGSSLGVSSKDGSSSGTSYGGVSAGTVVITDDKAQQALTGQTAAQAVAAVNNNVGVTNAGSISKDWNGQQLNSQVTANAQIVAAFGQQAATQIGNYADKQRDKLNLQADSLDKTDPEQAASVRAEAATWDEKGSNRVAMHTAAGLLGGGLGGAAGALASAEAMTTISDAIKGMGLPDSVSSGLAQIAATALGAAVGGGSGAAAALSVDANNRQLDKKEVDKLRELMQGKSPEEQQRLVDAACAKIRCADGMSDTNPAKADAVTSQQRGQDYVNEQNTLTSTGLFTYGALATAGDAASSVADSVSRQPIGRLASLAAGQAIDLGYGIVNLGIQVLSHGPSAIPQSPPDFPGDSNGPTGSAGAVVTATLPLYLCAPPVCLMTPPIVTGTSGAKWTNLTFSSGSDSGKSNGGNDGLNNGATSNGTANSATGAKLTDDLASNMLKPQVSNPKLAGLMDDLYRDGAKIGTGSTADAVRYETETGNSVGGVFHTQKAQNYSTALQYWLDSNPNASFSDRSAAQNVLRDLQNALKGK